MEYLRLLPNKKLNAIYFGLSLSEYEYATINKSGDISELQSKIRKCNNLDSTRDFFQMARGCTCEVYPFWPRAALLESALFFINDGVLDMPKYQNYVNKLYNITDEERNNDFFKWVENFPTHLQRIMQNDLFAQINVQLMGIVHALNVVEDLERLAEALSVPQMKTSINKIMVYICPLKCCYSADYFTKEDEMFVMLGDYLPHSIVHEYLHLAVNPLVQKHKEHITAGDKYPGIDSSYYLNGDRDGFLNAFEEYIVTEASEKIGHGHAIDIESLIHQFI